MTDRPPPDLVAARAHFARVDPRLHEATADLTPLTPQRPREPYVALTRAIVGQQLSTKAAATIWSRFEEHFGGHPPADVLAATDAEVLRGLGLSYRKAGYVRGVAEAALSGELHAETLEALDDEVLIDRLTSLRGVGRWTVEMILMFGMQRPDVFSVGDLGLRQAMVSLYALPEEGRALESRLRTIAAVWSPHRTTASRLLWSWHDRQRVRGSSA